MKLTSFAAAAAVAAAAVFSCLSPALAQQMEVVIGQPFIAAGTDPTKANNGWALASHGIAQNLFIVNKEGAVTPQLAAEAQRVDDRTWIVHLRRDVKFSDGSPLTAADAAAALLRNNELNPPARGSTGRIAVTALGPHSIRIESERAVPAMPSVLADWPQNIYKVAGGEFLFTGPFKVAREKPGAELGLVPNPHYPNAAKRPPVAIRYFADPMSMSVALQSGELDMAFGIPAEAVPRIAAQPGLAVRMMIDGYMYLLLMNHSRPPMDDARVRRAVDLAIDRELLVRASKGGKPAQTIYSAHYPYALKLAYPHDPAQAAKLLDEAGWKRGADGIRVKDGKRLTMTVVATSIWPELHIYVPVMKSELAKVGVELQPRMVEQFLPAANSGDFDLLFRMTHTARAGEPTLFLNDSLRSTAARNWGKYKGTELDALLAKLDSEPDMKQRAALVGDAQRVIQRDNPLTPIAEAPFHIGVSARLKDYPLWGADYYIVRDDLFVR